jgi:hypothetical protein
MSEVIWALPSCPWTLASWPLSSIPPGGVGAPRGDAARYVVDVVGSHGHGPPRHLMDGWMEQIMSEQPSGVHRESWSLVGWISSILQHTVHFTSFLSIHISWDLCFCILWYIEGIILVILVIKLVEGIVSWLLCEHQIGIFFAWFRFDRKNVASVVTAADKVCSALILQIIYYGTPVLS